MKHQIHKTQILQKNQFLFQELGSFLKNTGSLKMAVKTVLWLKKKTIKNHNADFLTATFTPHSQFEISFLEFSIFYLKKNCSGPKTFNSEFEYLSRCICVLLFSPSTILGFFFFQFAFILFLINRSWPVTTENPTHLLKGWQRREVKCCYRNSFYSSFQNLTPRDSMCY